MGYTESLKRAPNTSVHTRFGWIFVISFVPDIAPFVVLKEPDESIEQLLGLAVQAGLPMIIRADALRVGQVRQREDINISHIIALKLRREHIPEQL